LENVFQVGEDSPLFISMPDIYPEPPCQPQQYNIFTIKQFYLCQKIKSRIEKAECFHIEIVRRTAGSYFFYFPVHPGDAVFVEIR